MKKSKGIRLTIRMISLMMTVILVSESFLGSGIVSAAQDEAAYLKDSGQELTEEIVQAEDVDRAKEEYDKECRDILFEMEENRDQSSKHYRLSDGSIMAADYGMDIHYQKDGQWEEIDNRFVYEAADENDSMEGFATAEGGVEFKFAPDTSAGELVKAGSGGYSVSFEFLGTAAETKPVQYMEGEQGLLEMGTVSHAGEMEQPDAVTEQVSSVPLTFVKGEVLNLEEALTALEGRSAAAQVLEQQDAQVLPVASAYLTGEYAGIGKNNVADITPLEDVQDIWEEAGAEHPDASEEDSLMKQAALAHAVTSVGYENVLDGISLQYVAAGSSLKEYILVSEPQESYEYLFAVNLENLIPASQPDGSILLLDEKSGETVYEIPAAYMTDSDAEVSDAVDMELEIEADGRYLLKISADEAWLNEEGRAFPVKIDPTLNKRLTSSSNIRGNYVRQGKPGTSAVNYGEMYVGYDSSVNKNMITYIQLKNLPQLPSDSVICSSVFNMAVLSFSQVGWPKLHIRAKEVKNTRWDSAYTWNSRPQAEPLIIDQKAVTSAELYKYVGWDITSLVKEHYQKGNLQDSIAAFSLEAYGEMSNLSGGNAAFNLKWDGAEPIFQIFYRDTKGVEDYYSYQTQSIGRAGTGYISDYNSQLTVIKSLSAYESTVMPYDIGLVYTSATSGSYFTNGGDIHTADFSKMYAGTGWKLTLQETVVPVSVTDTDGTTTYLVYNDADGTEHYFHKSESDSSVYEDEDGLGLKIKKSSSKYELTDKKDNKKTFTNAGYLTKIEDANGNAINIMYSDGKAVSVESVPKGETAKSIFELVYSGNFLHEISDYAGRRFRFLYSMDRNGKQQLAVVLRYDAGRTNPNEYEAEYSYDAENQRLTHAYDSESNTGMYYTYQKGTTGYRVYEYHEYAASSILGTQTRGAGARTWSWEMRRARYRFSGADGLLDTEDDVINTYLFNSAGQTINARSENEKSGTLLGASAAAYTKNTGTSVTNNRMNTGITTGQSGVGLLINGGFEKQGASGEAALAWETYVSDASAARRSGETVDTRKALSGKSHYNLWGNGTSSVASIYQDVTVSGSGTYTFSAYVNTAGMTRTAADGGVYLYARRTDTQEVLGESVKLHYATDGAVEGGWQRLTAVFDVTGGVTVRFTVCSYHVAGLVMVDDVQMEKSSAASRFNHVYNGSFETADSRFGWDGTGSGTLTATREEVKHGVIAYKMSDPVPEATLYIGQTIQLYKNSNTTFLLSGWGKGNSVPDFAQEILGKNDSTLRFWGLTLTLNYGDGTASEHFHLPFSEYATDWQYAAMSVVPKAQDKLITTAELKLYYKNNANTAYFDSISLIEEPAQTYKYDGDGNLISVKSTGNGEDAYRFKEGTMDLTKVATEGSGDYTYEYKNTANKHLPTSIINDTVTMNVTYDAKGQTIGTTLENNKQATDLTMTSSAAYSDGLLLGVTDNTEAETSYSYDTRRRGTKVTYPDGTWTGTVYENVWDRATGSYINNKVSVANAYADGNLTGISRSGYLPGAEPEEENKKIQTYYYTYDVFGNVTGIDIGSLDYADYTYKANNGNLSRIEYGWGLTPQAVVDYSYDELDRVKEVQYYNNETSETKKYGYRYGSDGNLSGITENGVLAYTYDYDSLGRLIHSSMLKDGKVTLYTDHTYDTSDRLLTQSWQIGADGFSEKYTYNEADGTLSSMETAGDTLSYSYDGLKRLSGRTSSVLNIDYAYRNLSDTRTTTQIQNITYTKKNGGGIAVPQLGYAYDQRGNITSVTSGGSTVNTYAYDSQNQLVSEAYLKPYQGASRVTSSYVYDTYGNIRSITNNLQGIAAQTYTMEYGNASWLDQLTKVTYKSASGSTVSETLTYDCMGNPTRYFNGHAAWDFTWKFGRQLTNASGSGKNISYTYDVDGIRQSKTVNGSTTKYTTLDGKVVRETNGNITTDYFYDNEGKPYKLVVKDNAATYTGYYVLNQQGDVIAILDSAGSAAVSYDYNAWGKLLSETRSGSDLSIYLQSYNHLKYRGYYYDAETEFYYVSSRYYDPEVGRFISADTTEVLTASTTALTDKNLYAYCDNNPVVRKDTGGDYWETAFDVASWVVTASETLADPTNPWNWVALAGDTIDLATPIGGIGEAIKAYKAANRASDTISVAKKVDNGLSVAKKVHGNSLKSTKVNYGYALVNKNNEIMKFGETINPARRYTKKYLEKNGYKMKIIDVGSKSYIHNWQHDMNRYYLNKYKRLPPLNKRGW